MIESFVSLSLSLHFFLLLLLLCSYSSIGSRSSLVCVSRMVRWRHMELASCLPLESCRYVWEIFAAPPSTRLSLWSLWPQGAQSWANCFLMLPKTNKPPPFLLSGERKNLRFARDCAPPFIQWGSRVLQKPINLLFLCKFTGSLFFSVNSAKNSVFIHQLHL